MNRNKLTPSRNKPTPNGVQFFSQLKSQLYSGDDNKPFSAAAEFFSQKYREHKGKTANSDPIGLLVHHLNNGLTPLDADLYMITVEKRRLLQRHYREVLDDVDHFLAVIAEPMMNVREKLKKIFPKLAEYAEADAHLQALEAWRDKVRDEIRPPVTDKAQAVAQGNHATR